VPETSVGEWKVDSLTWSSLQQLNVAHLQVIVNNQLNRIEGSSRYFAVHMLVVPVFYVSCEIIFTVLDFDVTNGTDNFLVFKLC